MAEVDRLEPVGRHTSISEGDTVVINGEEHTVTRTPYAYKLAVEIDGDEYVLKDLGYSRDKQWVLAIMDERAHGTGIDVHDERNIEVDTVEYYRSIDIFAERQKTIKHLLRRAIQYPSNTKYDTERFDNHVDGLCFQWAMDGKLPQRFLKGSERGVYEEVAFHNIEEGDTIKTPNGIITEVQAATANSITVGSLRNSQKDYTPDHFGGYVERKVGIETHFEYDDYFRVIFMGAVKDGLANLSEEEVKEKYEESLTPVDTSGLPSDGSKGQARVAASYATAVYAWLLGLDEMSEEQKEAYLSDSQTQAAA